MSSQERTRRPRGDGSIYENVARGRWEAVLTVGHDPITGRPIRRTVTAATKSKVADRLRVLVKEHGAGLDVSVGRTVAQVAAEWMTKAAPETKAASTLARVRRRVDQHLVPAVGRYKIAELRAEHVEQWLAAEAARGAARRTVQDYRGDLRQILGWAQRRRLVDWNAAAHAHLPPAARPSVEKRTFTVEQALDLLDVLDRDDRLGPYFTVLLHLGLRPGEADALTWSAIAGDSMTIDRALQRDDHGRPIGVGPTKTKRSRELVFYEVVAAALRRQRALQAAERLAAGGGYSDRWAGHVFLNELGRPLNPSNVRRAFASICDRAGVPRLTPYELRHSAASLSVAAGYSKDEVADMLGHVDTRMLDRHYRHRPQKRITTSQVLAELLVRRPAT